jgi:lysyl-tRNA synthetase class 2
MKQYANVDLDPLLDDREALAEVVKQHGHTVTMNDSWDDLFFKIFLSEVEPKLGWSSEPLILDTRYSIHDTPSFQPTFLHNYPASMAALARKNPSDVRYALRTELYIGNLELANGFAELCDPAEQRTRFEEERELRKSLGKNTWDIDERFLQSLPGMGNAAGIAFGVDRLVMLLAGIDSISDLMPIPVRERFSNE